MRQIIALGKKDYTGYFELIYVYWLIVPINQQVIRANPNAASIVPDITADELNAIKTGSVVEKVNTTSFLNDVDIGSLASSLVIGYAPAQAEVNGANQWQYYLSSYDGTTWTVKGV